MGARRVGVIDLGTNTFHLVLATIDEQGLHIFYKDRVPVMIDRDGISQGKINDEAKGRAFSALKQFKDKIEAENIESVHATATSAFRNATNGLQLVDEIKYNFDLTIEIIDGEKEAEYIYHGVKHAMDISKENALIMDIGGGSVEFVIGNSEEYLWKRSFEIGAQRLLDLFHTEDPISSECVKDLMAYLDKELASLTRAVEKHKPTTLIGSAGTFDTLSEIYSIRYGRQDMATPYELPMNIDAYWEIYEELLVKNRTERLRIPGMIEMRVDMIVVACCLLTFVLKEYDLKTLRVSTYALKEGLLHLLAESVEENC